MPCLEIQKQFPIVCKTMGCTFKICNIYKNAEIMDKVLERTPSFYQKEILFCEKFSSCLTSLSTERKLKELREEIIREILANFQSQPFPRGLLVPTVLRPAHESQNYHRVPQGLEAPAKEQSQIFQGSGFCSIPPDLTWLSQKLIPENLQLQDNIYESLSSSYFIIFSLNISLNN